MLDFGSICFFLFVDGKIDSVKFDVFKLVFEILLLCIVEELFFLIEEDINVIIYFCLVVVLCKYMGGWVLVFNSGQLMFDDIDLLIMLQLVVWVVVDFLGNFL